MFKSEQMDSSRFKSMSDISVFCLGNINSHASMYLTHISYTGGSTSYVFQSKK